MEGFVKIELWNLKNDSTELRWHRLAFFFNSLSSNCYSFNMLHVMAQCPATWTIAPCSMRSRHWVKCVESNQNWKCKFDENHNGIFSRGRKTCQKRRAPHECPKINYQLSFLPLFHGSGVKKRQEYDIWAPVTSIGRTWSLVTKFYFRFNCTSFVFLL